MDESACPCDPGACECYSPQPGLEALPARESSFESARFHLLTSRQSVDPPGLPLAPWRGNSPNDLGNLLVEGFAYVQDVLSFYTQELQGEGFIGTARRQSDLEGLVALLGYRALPGVAGKAEVSLTVSEVRTQISAGMQFQSEPDGDLEPQVFTADEPFLASHLSNGWDVPLVRDPGVDRDRVLLLPELSRVVLDAPLVFRWVEEGSTSHSTVPVLGIEPVQGEDGVTYIEVETRGSPQYSAGLLRDEVQLLQPAQSASITSLPVGFEDAGENPQPLEDAVRPITVTLDSSGPQTFVLDAAYPQILPGQTVTIKYGTEELSLFVSGTVSGVLTGGEMSSVMLAPNAFAPVTTITVEGAFLFSALPFLPFLGFSNDLANASRYTILFEMVDVGRLSRVAKTTFTQSDLDEFGGAIPLVGPVLEPAPRFRSGNFFVRGDDGGAARVTGELVVDGASAAFEVKSGKLPAAGLQVPVRVVGNVVAVTRGEPVQNELLGSGDAAQKNQRFELARSPLTYISDATAPQGAKSTLEVRVNGIAWSEVDSFFGRGPDDEVFIVRHDEEQFSTVIFGDGVRGKRLPTGSNNLFADYRFGSGAEAPGAGLVNAILTPIRGLNGAVNPLAATGGRDPDSASELRTAAPAQALLLGRLVSVQDFQAKAALEPGVVFASARWNWDLQANRATVQVSYIGSPNEADLRRSLQSIADPELPIVVRQARSVPTVLALALVIDSRFEPLTVRREVIEVLSGAGGALSLAEIGIGETLIRSRIFEQTIAVPGVLSINGILLATVAPEDLANVQFSDLEFEPINTCLGVNPGRLNYFDVFAFDGPAPAVLVWGADASDPLHRCGI